MTSRPGQEFDLVHARLVVVHLPEREEALRRMASALRPGGWLVVEDFDIDLQPLICADAVSADHELANKVKNAFRALLMEWGVDPRWGVVCHARCGSADWSMSPRTPTSRWRRPRWR